MIHFGLDNLGGNSHPGFPSKFDRVHPMVLALCPRGLCITLSLISWERGACLHLFCAPPAKLFRTAFWMKSYQSRTSKRTRLWSTSWRIALFNRGSLARHRLKSSTSTATTQLDRQGVRRFTGKKKELKATQRLGWLLLVISGVMAKQPAIQHLLTWLKPKAVHASFCSRDTSAPEGLD